MIDKFMALVDEAHQLRLDYPRYPISLKFGRELASQSLEYKRLSDAMNWPWNPEPHSSTAVARAVAKIALLLKYTWLGKMIIRNRFLKTIGKRILKRLTNQSAA